MKDIKRTGNFLPEDHKSLKILAIGNSFSDDTCEYVRSMAKSAGFENVKLGNLYIGGCTLDTHAQNAEGDLPAYEYRTNSDGTWNNAPGTKMSDALKEEKWDFISLQQASGKSGRKETYGKLDFLIGYVRSLAGASPTLVWNMTWAYQQDSFHGEFPNYGGSQPLMYDMIIETVEDIVAERADFGVISPCGTAIQNARTSAVGDHLTRDGYHLSYDLGRYIAGLTYFSAITGYPADKVGFAPDGVSEENAAIARISAKNAVASPGKVTPFSI